MGQPTQRATNYTARSNIEPAQIILHANGQSAPRSGGARDVGRGEGSHAPSTASESFLHGLTPNPTPSFALQAHKKTSGQPSRLPSLPSSKPTSNQTSRITTPVRPPRPPQGTPRSSRVKPA